MVIVGCLVVVGIAWKIMSGQKSQSVSQSRTSAASKDTINFYGHAISRVDCKMAEAWAENTALLETSKDRYICHKGEFKASDEKLSYISITLTPEYEKQWSEQHPVECEIDCGSSVNDYPPMPPESENVMTIIVRANGVVEDVNTPTGGGSIDTLLGTATGCGRGSNGEKLDTIGDGSLVIDKNRVGLSSKFSDVKTTDEFGNVCTLDFEVIAYITTKDSSWQLTRDTRFNSLTVHYELQPISSCKNQSTPSQLESCYTSQAVMRNDASICESIVGTNSTNSGFDHCVYAIAKRTRDPNDCGKIRYFSGALLAQCQKDAREMQAVLEQAMVIK